MNTHQVEKYCRKCSENFNCPAYQAMNFTQMQGCGDNKRNKEQCQLCVENCKNFYANPILECKMFFPLEMSNILRKIEKTVGGKIIHLNHNNFKKNIMKKDFLHGHPSKQLALGISNCHVLVDRPDWEKAKLFDYDSWEQLKKEIKENNNNNVANIYYCDHRGMWTITYKTKLNDDEFETFLEVIEFLISTKF